MTDQDGEPLSPAGQARRDAMLDELTEVVTETRRTRKRRRRALAAGGGTAVALFLLVLLTLPAGLDHSGEARLVRNPGPAAPVEQTTQTDHQPACAIAMVQTDPDILPRHVAEPRHIVIVMDDRALLDTLAAMGRPTGLIRFGQQVQLSAPVTDEELGIVHQ